jgi:hypothetical protein
VNDIGRAEGEEGLGSVLSPSVSPEGFYLVVGRFFNQSSKLFETVKGLGFCC